VSCRLRRRRPSGAGRLPLVFTAVIAVLKSSCAVPTGIGCLTVRSLRAGGSSRKAFGPCSPRGCEQWRRPTAAYLLHVCGRLSD
jgi:hypothetical protein